MKSISILVIDDERVICDACEMVLSENGHRIDSCFTGAAGLRAIRDGGHDVILLDMKLPDIDGIEILQAIRKESVVPCVIVMTGYSTMTNAVEAMKLGAVDFLAKPFSDDDLIHAVETAFAKRNEA